MKQKFSIILALIAAALVVSLFSNGQAQSKAKSKVSVLGEVNVPGEYEYRENLTIRMALALAQGTTSKAISNKALLIHYNQTKQEWETQQIDSNKIVRGLSDDIKMPPSDILIIPRRERKTIYKEISGPLPNIHSNGVAPTENVTSTKSTGATR